MLVKKEGRKKDERLRGISTRRRRLRHPGFQLGTRRDAGRQLIRPKKPTIAFTVRRLGCIHLHTRFLCMRTHTRTDRRERMHPRRRVKDLMPLEIGGSSGSLLLLKRHSCRSIFYPEAIYGKLGMFGNISAQSFLRIASSSSEILYDSKTKIYEYRLFF